MSRRHGLSLCMLLVFVGVGSPVVAEADEFADADSTRQAIYQLENMIAFLEADPQTDDGYKAPIIRKARAEIRRLQATLAPAQWRWTTPCCYSRPPISIR